MNDAAKDAAAIGSMYVTGKHISSIIITETGFLFTYEYIPAQNTATANAPSIPISDAKAYPAATPEKISGNMLPPLHPRSMHTFTANSFRTAAATSTAGDTVCQLSISCDISSSPEKAVNGASDVTIATTTPAITQLVTLYFSRIAPIDLVIYLMSR